MGSKYKKNALIFSIIGLALDALSYVLSLLFFLAIPGLILGILGVINVSKAKSEKEDTTLELILSILATVLGGIKILLTFLTLLISLFFAFIFMK